MHLIQLARSQWLAIDDRYRPRFLIAEEAVVLRATGETHVQHVVRWWHLDPKERNAQAVCDGLVAAETWCRETEAQEAAKATQGAALDALRPL